MNRGSRFSRLPSNRDISEVAEGSAQQSWCEQRVCIYAPSVENRGSVGFAEDSHHSPNQLEQRARLPHFHADRSRIVLAKGSNQKGRSPIQYNRIPTVVQRMQSDPPPTSIGRRHTKHKGWSIRTVQSGSRKKVAFSFRSIRGRVAGQHVHGFLTVCRSVETEQNAWYTNSLDAQ